jgi:hypothetical protein
MKKSVLFFTIIFIVIASFELQAQKLISNRSVTGVCYAGTKVKRIYIPPPKGALRRADSKGGGSITVIYTGFTEEAKAAVDFAVKILEGMLPVDLHMTIKASWTKISDSGVLGNSAITAFAAGWAIDALNPFAYYPVAVAEKIAGKSLNLNSEADVELVLNSTAKWYLGTDGNTPTSKYDLVTVVIHELCHGLGFFDSMTTDGTTGSYGIGTYPVVYDTFIENLAGNKLTDTTIYKQNSSNLYNELVGGQLYFDGPLTRKYLNGDRARLYAPSTWDPGSSVSHLDELRTPQVNSLMTPFLDFGEAIHDPGNLTLSVLGDVGWINTRIIPGKVKDTEEHISEIEFTAEIRSDTSYNRNKVGLVYSTNGFTTSDTIIMTPFGSNNIYSCKVPILSYNVKLDYYMFAEDSFLRNFKSPSRAAKLPYTVFIGTDTVKPIIAHSQKEYFFEKIDSILFEATVTDNLGVDTVYVEYKVNNKPSKYFGLTARTSSEYSNSLIVKNSIKGGDSLNYRIIAIDKASGQNTRIFPSTGYKKIRIESLLPELNSYSTDFSNASADFFNSGFEITQPANFTSLGLHSEHPYQSPDKDDKTLDFSSVLRHPIAFDASGMQISFRELVLVEPGAEGSVFGFSDFYDYVILEASKDFGKNWFGLADGYDSRYISSWETAYNSSIDGQNSTYQGKESMMVTHYFYPRIAGKISEGDYLLIRFRLFSDPYAHGWGWAIDDLKINPLVDQAEEINIQGIRIYPNPGYGLFTVEYANNPGNGPLRLSVYSLTGQSIIQNLVLNEERMTIDISGHPPGLYLVTVNDGSGTKVLKYSLIK